MPAYGESLVSDAKRHLGSAFDYALVDCALEPAMLTALFLQSGIAALFEQGNPAIVLGMSGPELARSIISYAYGDSDFPPRELKDTPTPAYWSGWALAHAQWHTGRRFADIFRAVPLADMLDMHRIYHEMDISQFIEELERRIAAFAAPSRLQAIRQARGLSQAELARLSGVNVRNIQLYEQRCNDINKARGISLYRLAHVLGCHMDDLLENPTV